MCECIKTDAFSRCGMRKLVGKDGTKRGDRGEREAH